MPRGWSSLVGILVVFGIGAGGGFAWRAGWVPVEFRPAETGSLSSEWTDGLGATSFAPVEPPAEVLPIVPEQSEPEPLEGPNVAASSPGTLSPSATDGARSIADSRSIERRTPMRLSQPEEAMKGRVQSATFAEEAEETAPQSVQTSGRDDAAETKETGPGVSANPSLADELQKIDQQIQAGEFLPAHKELSRIYWERPADRAAIQSRLESTANTIFFQPQPHFSEPYVIQPGDRLESIAKKYKLSWEYLSALNRTSPTRIQAGKRLKVLKGPFSAAVDLQDFALTVHLQGYYVKRYEIGIGKDGSTPLGKFPVLTKIANPQYTDPDGRVIEGDDPRNPLGERWIDLGNSYGIHGTIEPESIGAAASRGCIRMRDPDIIEVYNFLTVGSEVTLRN